MNIGKATVRYEDWLGRQLNLIPADLAQKHHAMAVSPYAFFRATFYRWMNLWPITVPDCALAPEVLAVGDLHVENFGTWRDGEGRLVWGINDFDEAYPLPYTLDLVRLAASVRLAIADSHLAIEPADACKAILTGYREGLESGGLPLVLAEKHAWLRTLVSGALRNPERFWAKFDQLEPVRGVPESARKAIEQLMPDKIKPSKMVHRIAGLGSLGRERYVGIIEYAGAMVAREAKALAPSACVWAGHKSGKRIHYGRILDAAVRARDPYVKLKSTWIVRRLAPDCSRVLLASMPKTRQEEKLLHAMGWETANIHLGSKQAVRAIVRDLNTRDSKWLQFASAKMSEAIYNDFRAFKHSG